MGALLMANSNNLHRTLGLTAKRHCRDAGKQHPGGKLQQLV